MCSPTVKVMEFLDETPEADRRYSQPVAQKRIDSATGVIRKLMGVMEGGMIVEACGEIGLIECLDFNDSGGLRFSATGAQLVAMAAGLAAVYEESLNVTAPDPFVVA